MSRRAKSNLSGVSRPPAAPTPIASRSGKSSPPEVQPHPGWLSFAVCLFLALTVWAVFGQTLHHEFINYDDNIYVYENPTIIRGLSWDGAVWALTCGQIGHWHPVTWISHILDCQLYGLYPGGHHMTSVLLHAAAAMLLFLVLRNLTGALWRSAFVAAVFAIHPLRVESVAWVAERKDVLSALFFMLTLWAYTRYAQKRSRDECRETGAKTAILAFDPRCWTLDYYLALTFFALGLLSKSMLVTLPFVLLLLDYWPLNRFPHRASRISDHPSRTAPALRHSTAPILHFFLEKIPFFALSATSCIATSLVPEQVTPSDRVAFSLRFGSALDSYITYLWQMICPAKLAIPYLYPASGVSLGVQALALVLLVAISLLAAAWWRTHPYFAVGWLWYLGMLVPVIGLVQISYYARADRYTYLPQIGLYMMVAWGAAELSGGWRYRRAVLGSTAGAILAGLLAAAYVQTGYWKDSISLWTHTLAYTSGNYTAHYNLGNALIAQGKRDEGIDHYERALQLKPDYADAHNNLGVVLAGQGKLKEAMQHYKQVLQINPDHAEAHYNLGNVLAGQGKLKEAIDHYEQALQLKPDYAEAHYNLSVVLAVQGKLQEAMQHFERTLQLNPDHAMAHYNLGNVLAGQGKLQEAMPHFERTLQLKPDYADAHYNLGNVLAEQGKLKEAISHFQQALNLATAQNNTALAESIRTRLKSYEARQ